MYTCYILNTSGVNAEISMHRGHQANIFLTKSINFKLFHILKHISQF